MKMKPLFYLSRALSVRRIVAASVLILSSIALLGNTKTAHAYWGNLTYAGTGKLLHTGPCPVGGATGYIFNNTSITGAFVTTANPAFSSGDGALSTYILSAGLQYPNNTTATSQVDIDTTATPAIPVITITATWIPAPTTDVNMDGFINALDDPAPVSAPTPNLRVSGSVFAQRGRGPSNIIEAYVDIATSYRNSGGTWVSASSVLVNHPITPVVNKDEYNESDVNNSAIGAYTYSGGVATYQIRVDQFSLLLDGTTSIDSVGMANTMGSIQITSW